MQDALDEVQAPPAPFPFIRMALQNRRLVVTVGTAGVAALGCWAAFRTGVVDLYPISLLLAIAVHLILRVAIEVVDLVAETLMPR